MTEMRLQKFLSRAGICSRRKGEEYITAGWVRVNGKIVTELGVKVDPERDTVEVDTDAIQSDTAPTYIALNKPSGYVSSCHQQDEKIVLDLLDISERVYPVGRLDKESTGLLLEGVLRKLAEGLPMMGTRTRPARVKRISARRFWIVLQEGKNRQIRRMVRKVGNQVTHLKRIRIANIKLGNLPPGSWRYLMLKAL
jgi:23S rRNA pseudouridine2605 synthase/23S rRNA pseudouridine2604 synthase